MNNSMVQLRYLSKARDFSTWVVKSLWVHMMSSRKLLSLLFRSWKPHKKPCVIVPPLPRYLVARCCSDMGHCTNTENENYAKQLLTEFIKLKNLLTYHLVASGISNFKVMDTYCTTTCHTTARPSTRRLYRPCPSPRRLPHHRQRSGRGRPLRGAVRSSCWGASGWRTTFMSRLLFSRLLLPVRRRRRARRRLHHRLQSCRSFLLTPPSYRLYSQLAPWTTPLQLRALSLCCRPPPEPALSTTRAPMTTSGLSSSPPSAAPAESSPTLTSPNTSEPPPPPPWPEGYVFWQTQIESFADIAVKGIITTNGIVIAI